MTTDDLVQRSLSEQWNAVPSVRLTPAQQRALRLLATPGAEAHGGTPSYWFVWVDGHRVGGLIRSESLSALRQAGLVEWLPSRCDDTRWPGAYTITDRGRQYLAEREGT